MPTNLNILFIGDIIGQPGLEMTTTMFRSLMEKYRIDFCIANGENLTDGKGISEEDSKKVFDLGVHVITTGNHVWDRWDSRKVLGANRNILRPLNYPRDNGGNGFIVYELEGKAKIGVINVQGRTFMQPLDDPFKTVDWALSKINEQTKICVVDFHAEATAEKIAMGWHLDGRVSAIWGTHTHVQTADECVLPGGTGYITDLGTTGPRNSILGVEPAQSISRFLGNPPEYYRGAEGPCKLEGAIFSVDAQTGRCTGVERVRLDD